MEARILIVEDNAPNRQLARYLLEAHGFSCDEAIDGETALVKLRGEPLPDLVICDLRLPGIDGFEVLGAIRADAALAQLPVIAVTAYAMVGDRERILDAGFDGYIAKPLDPQNFAGEIEGYVQRARPAAPMPQPTPEGQGARILVVDDRPVNRELLMTVLTHYGHTVLHAADGVEALACARHQPLDLVITDLLMPNMDGEELCRRLRDAPATAALPIIIHTASYRARQGRQVAERVGVRWVLPKPCEPADLMAMVAEALGVEQSTVRPAPGAGGTDPGPDTLGVDNDVASLQVRNRRLTLLLENAVQIAVAQNKTLESAAFTNEQQSLAQRLSSLVSLGLELTHERNPDALVHAVGAAAQDIMSARFVGIVIGTPDAAPRSFVSRGLKPSVHDAVAAEIGHCMAARRLLGPGAQGRMLVAGKPDDFTGLPAAHPPVRNLIACRVGTGDLAIGWIYAAHRLGDDSFTADDERLLLSMASMLGTAWDSLMVLSELDRRVAERTRELEALNAELEAFSILVSHDLRSPLGSIEGFARALAEKHASSLPPDAARYIGNIERNVKVMTALIEDLFRFAKSSRTGMVLRQVSLSELVAECLAAFQEEIARRQVAIHVGPMPECRADPALLAQVLLNLVGNALKYTRHQSQPVIDIAVTRTDSEIVVCVSDNGVGFDPEYAGRLFNPFQRLHSRTEFEGSGVGLALVKQVISRHGGRVWAESEPGQGARFYFSLPV